MKEIIALQEYTDKYISLYQGEIRNVENGIADLLIEQGIVAEHGEDSEKINTEIIEIGTSNAGGSQLQSQLYFFQGSINLKQNKTIAELIKNKKINDFLIEITPRQGLEGNLMAFNPVILASNDLYSTSKDIRLYNDLSLISYLSVFCFVKTNKSDEDPSGSTLTVYAICS